MIKKQRLQRELHPIHIIISKHNPVNFSKYSSRRNFFFDNLRWKKESFKDFFGIKKDDELGKELQIFGAEEKKDLFQDKILTR